MTDTPIWSWPQSWWQATDSKFSLQPRSLVSASPWTGRRNVYGPQVQVWVADITFMQLYGQELQARSAFMSRLEGQKGLIRMGDVARRGPSFNLDNTAFATPWSDGTFFSDGTGWIAGQLPSTIFLIQAANRGDKYVVVGGLPVSTPRALRRGDLFQIKPGGIEDDTPHLYEVMQDAPTDANGKTGFEIRPALRAGVAVGDTVLLNYPTSVFQLADDSQGVMSVSLPFRGDFGFKLIEAII